MNLVIDYSNNRDIQGITATLIYSDINFIRWDSSKLTPYDMYYTYKPDYILTIPQNITPELKSISREKKVEIIGADLPKYTSNPVQYLGGQKTPKYESFVIFTNPHINLTKVDMIFEKCSRVKMWGDFPIDRPQYLGPLKTYKERSDAIKSAWIFIDDGTNEANAHLLETLHINIDTFFSANSFMDKIKNHSDNKSVVLARNKEMSLKNTYFHYITKLLNDLGQKQLSEQVSNKWKSLLLRLQSTN